MIHIPFLSKLSRVIGQNNWRILSGLITVSFFVFFGKIAGAAKEVGIAWKFGISDITDIYGLAFVVVIWLPSILTSALNAVYVPLSRRLSVELRKEFSSELQGAIIVLGILAALFIALLVAPFLPTIASPNSTSTPISLEMAIAYLSPTVCFMSIASILSARLLAEERHVNTLLESLPSLTVLVFIILIADGNSIVPLVVGTVFGQLIHLVFLIVVLNRANMELRVRFSLRSSAWSDFFSSFGILILGTFVMSLVPLVDQFLAARLNDGSVSTLNYATKLLALVLGLGATAIARAILPVLSDKNINYDSRVSLAKKWSLILLFAGFLASAIGWFMSSFAVSVLFERGAFNSEDGARVSEAVRYGVAQLPFYFASIVLVQLFASLGEYKSIVVSSCLALLVKLVVGGLLANEIGVTGITLSTGAMYAANSIYFLWCLRRFEKASSDVV